MSHDQTLQEAFKRDGFVHLPAAETPDLLGVEHPLDELDEVPVDDEFVEEHIVVGKVVGQAAAFGRIVFERFPGREGLADLGGDGGPFFLWIEILDDDESPFDEGLQVIV